MTIQIEIPAEIEQALREQWHDLPRAILEATAIEAYRNGVLSHKQLGDLLGMESWWDVENFLGERQVPRPYGPEDLEQDLRTIEDLDKKPASR